MSLALVLVLAAIAPPGLLAADTAPAAARLIDAAKSDLARNDGLAAAVRLEQALEQGIARDRVAAYLGAAFLAQGDRASARKWLSSGRFDGSSAAHGFHALALLEMREGNLPAAGHAFDRALAIAPRDAAIWVDVARLRYRGGEQVQAVEAADRALALEPANVRALELRGRMVRDRYGLRAALPWFDAALKVAPGDLVALGEKAATLGDLDRGREMLAVTRQMLRIDPRSTRALYLQAVLAARAGNDPLARSLLNRTGKRLANLPGAMLLDAVLDIRMHNYGLALVTLERLLRRQPGNARAQLLMARALFLDGKHRQVIDRFGAAAAREDAAPYLLALVGRSFESVGDRQSAAPLLDRANRVSAFTIAPLTEGSPLGSLIAQGRLGEAQALAEANRAANPGSAGFQTGAGDVQLAGGNAPAALERYYAAARVRLPQSLLLKMVAAHVMARDERGAALLVEGFLVANPSSRDAAWQAGRLALAQDDWSRAALLLEHVERAGSGRDVGVLADLSLARLRSGDTAGAVAAAERAYRLQPMSGPASAALALAIAAQGGQTGRARALLAKARAISANDPHLAETRRLLQQLPSG